MTTTISKKDARDKLAVRLSKLEDVFGFFIHTLTHNAALQRLRNLCHNTQ